MAAKRRERMLAAALKYRDLGFSVIPVRQDKKPYIKWRRYQSERADAAVITKWWRNFPDAAIGLVTGEISGIDVVDADSEAGREALNEYLSDSILIPTSKTPKGWHFYFRHTPGLCNGVRLITDCDLRTEGGFIVAPPSRNGRGCYAWLDGLRITDVAPPAMPGMLIDVLMAGAGPASALTREHIKTNASSSGVKPLDGNSERNKTQHSATKHTIGFDKGLRDYSLFHIANCLVKGGMDQVNIRKILLFIAKNCTPPFTENETEAKIQSALKRSENRNRNLTQDIRDWISATSGNFSATFLYGEQQCATSEEKAKVRMILTRLVREGVLERNPDKAGHYRIIDNDCEAEDWQNACTDTVKLWLPFELDTMIEIPPGSVILFAGAQDAGKSAIMMNIARYNMHSWKTHYFSSELNSSSFKSRVSKFPDITPDMWKIGFYPRTSNFADVLKTGLGNLNLIDYLEIHDQFYLVSKHLAEIHRRLDGAIAIIALQKDPKALYGRGGSFTQEKPILSVSIDRGVATISKFKGEWQGSNPNGKQYRFKIVDGCRLVKVSGWQIPAPK
jgi:hypothetical protein